MARNPDGAGTMGSTTAAPWVDDGKLGWIFGVIGVVSGGVTGRGIWPFGWLEPALQSGFCRLVTKMLIADVHLQLRQKCQKGNSEPVSKLG